MSITYIHKYRDDIPLTELTIDADIRRAIHIAQTLEIDLKIAFDQNKKALICEFKSLNDRLIFLENSYPEYAYRKETIAITFKNAQEGFIQAWQQAINEFTQQQGIECSSHIKGNILTTTFNTLRDITIYKNGLQANRYAKRAAEILQEQNLD